MGILNMDGISRFYVCESKIISTCTIQISLELTEPEALADFLRSGSASASGSMNCIGKFKLNRTGRNLFAARLKKPHCNTIGKLLLSCLKCPMPIARHGNTVPGQTRLQGKISNLRKAESCMKTLPKHLLGTVALVCSVS